jgi:hypothetical protein
MLRQRLDWHMRYLLSMTDDVICLKLVDYSIYV